MSNLKSFVLLAAAAAASMGAAGVASATASQPGKMVVHFKPEDLTSEEGIKKLYFRIRLAAENVCPSVSTGTYLIRDQAMSCRKAAIENAVEAIHNKRLAEIAAASKFA